MSTRAAVLELRHRVLALQARLEELDRRTQRAGGGSVHNLMERVDAAAVDALGWVRGVRKAVRKAARGASQAEVSAALSEVRRGLGRLKRNDPAALRNRRVLVELGQLADPKAGGKKVDDGVRRWAADAVALVRAAAEAMRAVDAALSACLPADVRRVVVKTITVVE
jgi:hypothetical protein